MLASGRRIDLSAVLDRRLDGRGLTSRRQRISPCSRESQPSSAAAQARQAALDAWLTSTLGLNRLSADDEVVL